MCRALLLPLLFPSLVHAQQAEVVGLGEEAHGYASLNGRKAGVVRELVAGAVFDAVIMESSFAGAVAASLQELPWREAMDAFVYPFWLTDTVVHTLEHAGGTGARPRLYGCDIQEDCRFHRTTLALLETALLQPWAERLLRCDSVLDRYIGPAPIGQPMSAADRLFVQADYRAIMEAQQEPGAYLLQLLQNRIWLCDYLALKNVNERMSFRDSLMAVNVQWISAQLGPHGRVLLWAADLHVRKALPGERPRWCGEYLGLDPTIRYTAISVALHKRQRKRFDRQEVVRDAVRLPPERWRTPCP